MNYYHYEVGTQLWLIPEDLLDDAVLKFYFNSACALLSGETRNAGPVAWSPEEMEALIKIRSHPSVVRPL